MTEERDSDAPSLEPPSLFGRKKRKPRAAGPAPEPRPAPQEPVVEPVVEPAAPPVAESPTTILDEPEPEPSTVLAAPEPAPRPAPEPEPEAPRAERPPRDPWLVGPPAAVLTGLLVGALIVAATAGGLRVCTSVKGTSSCGNPGFLMLCAILVVAVLLGGALLRAARVPQPGSTSFLAVGLLSVVALLFLVGQLFEWWMAIVIPLVSVATFLLSYWVTTTYIEPSDDARDPEREPASYDVR